MRALLILVLLACPADAQTRPTERPERVAAMPFPAWIAGFRDRALAEGIAAPTFDTAMADVTYLPDVIRLDRRQSEFTKTIWDYLDAAASETRVRNGRAALDRHAATFAEIEAAHGVPREIVAAIWGLETSYGAVRGDTPILSALATLAADSRRGAFFEEQLIDALRILDAGAARPADLRGSWAGAMGHTQFLPSSWHAHAVDHDGDGRRDIWGDDPADALASAAAYLKGNGWITGQPWGAEVSLPEGFDYRLTGERVTRTAPEWTALGVRTATGAPLVDAGPISIRVPGGHEGAAFATYGNFRALESYNTADAYVIAVGHLSDRLAGGGPLAGGWPRGDRALTYDERIALQEGLREAGFDPLRIDARIGPDTLDAIQRWQTSEGLVPDGYVDADLLARLLR